MNTSQDSVKTGAYFICNTRKHKHFARLQKQVHFESWCILKMVHSLSVICGH